MTISLLTGNGLFEKAKQARNEHINLEMKEKLNLAIAELQVEKNGNATLEDITENWINEKLKDYEGVLIDTNSTFEKKIRMKKDGIIKIFTIDFNLDIKEDGGTEFSFQVGYREGNNANILIIIRDSTNGINRIELPDKDSIICNGKKEEIGIDYVVQIGVEYIVKIILPNGEEKQGVILVDPDIEISNIIIGTSIGATETVEDNSQTRGTKLYINFNATLEGELCTIEPNVPYEINRNGIYSFYITGIYDGRTIKKKIDVEVKKYQASVDYVQYNAGDWTKEEVDELKGLKLYDLNIELRTGIGGAKLSNDINRGLTFGGFTYKGDKENENKPGVITSRNSSPLTTVGDRFGGYPGYAKYDGWEILESEEKDGKIYVKKIVHAGVPENFTCIFETGGAYRAEYLLTGNAVDNKYKTTSDGININVRNWNMYKDKELDKKGYIDEVHCMTYYETLNIANIKKITGSIYWTATALRDDARQLIGINASGNLYATNEYCFGIRPIITMTEGVYIVSGIGTEDDPYVLGK